jgi:hypothetical protein
MPRLSVGQHAPFHSKGQQRSLNEDFIIIFENLFSFIGNILNTRYIRPQTFNIFVILLLLVKLNYLFIFIY